jgi:hypothetical protein
MGEPNYSEAEPAGLDDPITTVEDCILFFRAPEQPDDTESLRFVCGLGHQLADALEAERIENAHLRDAVQVFEKASNEHEREVERLREQLSAAHDVRDVFARDLNRMVADCEKDEAALAAAVRELRGENLRLTHESNGRQFRLQQAEAALHALENKCIVSESAYVQGLEAALAAAREAGYVLAMRLVQSDLDRDDVERAACDLFIRGHLAAKEPTP